MLFSPAGVGQTEDKGQECSEAKHDRKQAQQHKCFQDRKTKFQRSA